MKIKWCAASFLMLIFGAGIHLNAQWSDEQRGIFKSYKERAEMGDPAAQCKYARYFDGITNNPIEAAKWYRRAAEQGYGGGQLVIGLCYESGCGVATNFVESYKWLKLSLGSDSPGDFALAKMQMNTLESKMNQDQFSEALRLFQEFKPHKESSFSNTNTLDSPLATGTGFFITDDGYLISNYHVIKDATKLRLLAGAGLIDAVVVKVDVANDLALLQAVGRFTPLAIVSSRTVQLGGTVATIGFPDIGLQGFSPKLAKGEIASLSGAADDPRYFQISVPVQPGNSGGALVDEHGNVVGIVAAKLDAQMALNATGALPENVNYAVKSSFLLGFLESVPDVANKLKDPNTKDEPFEDAVKSAQDAAVLVLVY